jgi:hypothetical protein
VAQFFTRKEYQVAYKWRSCKCVLPTWVALFFSTNNNNKKNKNSKHKGKRKKEK